MVTVPLYVFLFLYFGFLLFFATFLVIGFSQLVHTGAFTLASFLVSFFFLAYTAVVLWGTAGLLAGLDWQQPVTVWNSAWLGNVFSKQEIFGGLKM